MTETTEWNVGDRVACDERWGRIVSIGKVVRLTKTQVVAQFSGRESRFRRTSGKSISTSSYDSTFLRHATDSDFIQLARQNTKTAIAKLSDRNLDDVPDSEIRKVREAVLNAIASIDAAITSK